MIAAMVSLGDMRRRARHLAPPLLAAAVVGYFGYHAIQGERGLLTWLKLGQRIEERSAALAVSQAEENRLGHRVALLRPDGLDLDMLDERARVVLNLADPDDVVMFDRNKGARP